VTPELLLALVSGRSIALSEPVGGRRPEWSVIEFGWGESGLPRKYAAAFRFRHARDNSVYHRLYRYLRIEAERLAWREKWKRRIAGRRYLDELVRIVLLEEILSNLDRTRLLMRLEDDWDEGVFAREIQPKMRAIGMILDRWTAAAHEHIAYQIRQDEEEYEVA